MRNRNITIILATIICLTALAEACIAAGRTYVDRRRSINAGVLVIKNRTSGNDIHSEAGYIFYIMNQRVDIKPSGWAFVNPLAGGNDTFKNYKKYWEVPLRQTTVENLAKFDVLYLCIKGLVELQMDERDKLRRFVDGGGCLWIDNGFRTELSNDPVYSFFLRDVDFPNSMDTGNPTVLASLHPLMTFPFWLAPGDIRSLDMLNNSGSRYYVDLGIGGSLPNPTALASIVELQPSGHPTIACAEYGSGRLVMTSGFIGAKIQYPVDGGANPDTMNPNVNFLLANPANLKFAYNLVAWASSATTLRVNYRHDGYSLENIGAPLSRKWSKGMSGSDNKIEVSAAVWKNVLFYSSGTTLYALDAVPEEDLDMNGNP